MVRIGFVELPEEKGCSGDDCENHEVKKPLDPPELMIGCHKTSENSTKRGFSSGSFDEVAFWGSWLNDTVKPYFLGGYSKYKITILRSIFSVLNASRRSLAVLESANFSSL